MIIRVKICAIAILRYIKLRMLTKENSELLLSRDGLRLFSSLLTDLVLTEKKTRPEKGCIQIARRGWRLRKRFSVSMIISLA